MVRTQHFLSSKFSHCVAFVGQTIAIAHDPPCITLHSIQDGHEERALFLATSSSEQQYHFTNMWWFRKDRTLKESTIPDIFKRNGVVVSQSLLSAPSVTSSHTVKTGSAHSILNMLPLLDPLQEESHKITSVPSYRFTCATLT